MWLRTPGVEADERSEERDAQLVILIGRGCDDALGEVYDRHGGAVFGLARRLLHDRTRAEDIVQEVFLRLWAAPDRFDPSRGSLRGWLLTQTHGRSVDVLRSDSARRRREVLDAGPGVVLDGALDAQLIDVAVCEQVRGALDDLPAVQREAIELAYFTGRSYRQVAALLGVAEGTVKSRIRTGLGRIRDELIRRGVEPSWQTT